ncbi:hypothetical protein JTE90_007138 [Oedothorax gibbosus]|uniref:Uncharacterized protein n=1 Tax=Oedothorax gibbosus TaxID=931172 RepID=A0AAV6VTQ8_9ARAC|nr:hypothetical protein JTE90_007138 [Oedothorax gibbosus]
MIARDKIFVGRQIEYLMSLVNKGFYQKAAKQKPKKGGKDVRISQLPPPFPLTLSCFSQTRILVTYLSREEGYTNASEKTGKESVKNGRRAGGFGYCTGDGKDKITQFWLRELLERVEGDREIVLRDFLMEVMVYMTSVVMFVFMEGVFLEDNKKAFCKHYEECMK